MKNLNGDYVTLEDAVATVKDAEQKKLFYVTDLEAQDSYVRLFKDGGKDAYVLNTVIDAAFINFLESKLTEEGVSFTRIDTELSAIAQESQVEDVTAKEALTALFQKAVGQEQLKVELSALASESIPAMILVSEQARRFQDMAKMYNNGMDYSQFAAMFQGDETLVLNQNNPLVMQLSKLPADSEDAALLAAHVYDLAKMVHAPLTGDAMAKFVERSTKIMMKGL